MRQRYTYMKAIKDAHEIAIPLEYFMNVFYNDPIEGESMFNLHADRMKELNGDR